MPLKRSKLRAVRAGRNISAAVVLLLGAVHAEACIPALTQFATAHPDAPVALVALLYHRSILSLADTVLATRPLTSTCHTATAQALRKMEMFAAGNRHGSAPVCVLHAVWALATFYTLAFLHYNTFISCMVLCYAFLPSSLRTVLTTVHDNFKIMCTTKDPWRPLAAVALRVIVSAVVPPPISVTELSIPADSYESSATDDESLPPEDVFEFKYSDAGLQDRGIELMAHVTNFIFSPVHERTPEECKAIAMNRRQQDPRPDIARPSPEYLLELEEEEHRQELHRQSLITRRRRARVFEMLLSLPPVPYQLGYIAFPIPDYPYSKDIERDSLQKPLLPSQIVQPILQGFTFASSVPYTPGPGYPPYQLSSRFEPVSSPFAASATLSGFNQVPNIPVPNTTDYGNKQTLADQSIPFVDIATFASLPASVNNPFAAYAAPTSPFVTRSSAMAPSTLVPNTPGDNSNNGVSAATDEPFTPAAPTSSVASHNASNNPFAAYVSSASPFATGSPPSSVFSKPAAMLAQNASVSNAASQQTSSFDAATRQRNDEGYEIIDEDAYYA
ncbi:unnamed protein product [Peniophora sp. CBMAI 1063]|nr:unnamed protein product [Peniophora sp. CBMAI 1063]